ncbi:hypothetical protein [Paenibacillus sp. EPM92]|uniref:hypothetical protein n=1 Tax=Paenibacillus sp. EPM92 TaxID=1561195 RepID=UPI0019160B72|nr:hypothetical protein [Paenibacillus sp. EPM92]
MKHYGTNMVIGVANETGATVSLVKIATDAQRGGADGVVLCRRKRSSACSRRRAWRLKASASASAYRASLTM